MGRLYLSGSYPEQPGLLIFPQLLFWAANRVFAQARWSAWHTAALPWAFFPSASRDVWPLAKAANSGKCSQYGLFLLEMMQKVPPFNTLSDSSGMLLPQWNDRDVDVAGAAFSLQGDLFWPQFSVYQLSWWKGLYDRGADGLLSVASLNVPLTLTQNQPRHPTACAWLSSFFLEVTPRSTGMVFS